MSIFLRYKDKIITYLYLIFCLFLISPLNLVYQPSGGLDASWQIAMSLAEKNHLTFGKDFIFSFGPLGFLHSKYIIAHSKYWLLLFDSCILFCCGVVLWHFLQKYQSWRQRRLFLPVLFALKMSAMTHLLMPLYIYFTLYYCTNKKLYALFLSSTLVCLSFYIKVNYGIILVAVQIVALLYLFLIYREKRIQLIGIFFYQALLLLAPSFFLNVSLMDYITGSLHLISAYNDSMYLPIRWIDLKTIFAISLIALFFYLLWLTRPEWFRSREKILGFILCSLYFYLIFKNGFVRNDSGHMNEFFRLSFLPFIIWYFYFGADLPKKYSWVIFCMIVLTYVPLAQTKRDRALLNKELLSLSHISYIQDIFTDQTEKKIMDPQLSSSVKIKPYQLSLIGKSSVDIIPWEISEIYLNGLSYDPRPVIQSYSAYDRYLDQKNYEKYTSASAPDFLLFSLMTIDNRYPFWDESITKRAILSNYRLISDRLPEIKDKLKMECFDSAYYLAKNPDVSVAIKEGKFKSAYDHYLKIGKWDYRPTCEQYEVLLLKKRTKPLTTQTIKKTTFYLTINEEYIVPESDQLLYLYANVKYNLMGKLLRIFSQPPPLMVRIKYNDGTEEVYRAILPILKTGVLINKKITTTAEAAGFFFNQGRNNTKIVGIKFEAGYGFEKNIEAYLEEIRLLK